MCSLPIFTQQTVNMLKMGILIAEVTVSNYFIMLY